MALVIPVAHDFICPWCWIMISQAQRLRMEFNVVFDWQGYELWPEDLAWPDPPQQTAVESSRPKTPSRLNLALAAEGLEYPSVARPPKMRTFRAHQALEYAKRQGVGEAFMERLYRAYWLEGKNINELDVLKELAAGMIFDIDRMVHAIESKAFDRWVVKFDDEAHSLGVYNVPTYFIGGQKYAEQPFSVLRAAILRELGEDAPSDDHGSDAVHGAPHQTAIPYDSLSFAEAPEDRPYIVLNMATTIDGKTVTGTRTEPVGDLGSELDHSTMRSIQQQVDAVLLGAGSLRSTPGLWYPKELKRFVATYSGELNYKGRFFSDLSEGAFVVTTKRSDFEVGEGIEVLKFGKNEINWGNFFAHLRKEMGVKTLLIEGGSELNASILEVDLVDEIFVTICPKLKLGRKTPTLAGGDAFDRDEIPNFSLVSCEAVGDEVFLRYRRLRKI